MDSVKNRLSDSNFWDDIIVSNYLKCWDENVVAGFGDVLKREITAFCNWQWRSFIVSRNKHYLGLILAINQLFGQF